MVTVDKNNNHHAHDGKFTHKPAGESAAELAIGSSKEKLRNPQRFSIPGPRDNTVNVSAQELPEWPQSLPEPQIGFGFDEEGRIYMEISNPQTDSVDFYSEGSYEELLEAYPDLDDEQQNGLDAWVSAVFGRGRQVASALSQRAVTEETFTQISEFAQGSEPASSAGTGVSHQDRAASIMQEGLSGYLRPADDPEDKESSFADVLANLRHYAAKHGIDFDSASEQAAGFFAEEQAEDAQSVG